MRSLRHYTLFLFRGVTGLCSFQEGKWGDSSSCKVSCSHPVFSVHQCCFQLYAMYGSRLTRESRSPAFSPCLAVSAVVQSSSLFSIQESHEKKASGQLQLVLVKQNGNLVTMPSPILVPMQQRKVMGKKKVFILVLRRPVLLIELIFFRGDRKYQNFCETNLHIYCEGL